VGLPKSTRTIAAATKACISTVSNHVQELLHQGLIERSTYTRCKDKANNIQATLSRGYCYQTTPAGAQWALKQIELAKARKIST